MNVPVGDSAYDSGTPCTCSRFQPTVGYGELVHMGSQTLEFTDESAVIIEGEVLFDNNLELLDNHGDPGIRCPLQGATVHVMLNGEPSTTDTDAAGRFQLAASKGDMLELFVTYGAGAQAHHFYPKSDALLVGTTSRKFRFLDQTQRQVSLRIVDESLTHQLYDENLKWTVTADHCTDSNGESPVTFELQSPSSRRGLAVIKADAKAGEGKYYFPAIQAVTIELSAPPTRFETQVKNACDDVKKTDSIICAQTDGVGDACTLQSNDVLTFFEDLQSNRRILDLTLPSQTVNYIYETLLCVQSSFFTNFPETGTSRCPDSLAVADAVVNKEVTYTDHVQNQGTPLPVGVTMFQIFANVFSAVQGSITVEEDIGGEDSPCIPGGSNDEKCRHDVPPECKGGEELGSDEVKSCVAKFVVNVGPPKQTPPHLAKMTLFIARKPYTHCREQCTITDQMNSRRRIKVARYVGILGDIEKDGPPQTFTASTGKSLVFDVLHDPPGGLSTATWTEGSERSYKITLDEFDAKSLGSGITHQVGGGINLATQAQFAPFGMGTEVNLAKGGIKYGKTFTDLKNTPTSTDTSSYESGWSLTLTLSKAISTSSNPGTAGKASDLILGGGLELRFTMEFRFFLDNNKDGPKRLCIGSKDVTKWQPSVLTTFILSYREIKEQMLRIKAKKLRLAELASQGNNDVASKAGDQTDFQKQSADLDKYLQNWEQVLKTYEGTTEAKEDSLGFKTHLQNQLDELSKQTDKSEFDRKTREVANMDGATPLGQTTRGETYKGETVASGKGVGPGRAPILNFTYTKRGIGSDDKAAINDNAFYYEWAKAHNKMFTSTGDMKKYAALKDICISNLLGFGGAHTDYYQTSSRNEQPDVSKPSPLLDKCKNLANFPRDTTSLAARRAVANQPLYPGAAEGDDMSIEQGQLDALKDDGGTKSFITFNGGGEMIEFTHGISSSVDISLGMDKTSDADWHTAQDNGEDLTILVLNADYSWNSAVDATDSSDSTFGHDSHSSYSAEVVWSVGDPNLGDKFVIEVQDNPLYGTPLFRTLGGASRCPAEPNTQKREAKIRSMSVTRDLDTCKESFKSDTFCELREDGDLTWANFDVKLDMNYENCVIEDSSGNCNPAYKETDYRFNFLLRLEDPYAANVQGLIIMVNGLVMGAGSVVLPLLPFGVHTFSMQVGRYGSTMSRNQFEQIELKLVSACENSLAEGGTLCIIDQTALAADSVDGATNSSTSGTNDENALGCQPELHGTTKFSVSWPSPQRRASSEVSDMGLSENIPLPKFTGDSNGELMQLRAELKLQFQQMHQTQQMNFMLSMATASLLVVVAVALVTSAPWGNTRRSVSSRSISPLEYSEPAFSDADTLPLVGSAAEVLF